MTAFLRRNLRVFFRDRATVFFSLLASLIIVGLYVLFLGDVYQSDFPGLSNAREILDNWVMAGLLATTTVTAAMGALGVMVSDRAQKIRKDFVASPIRAGQLAGGYLCSAFVIGFVLSLVTLVLAQGYIVYGGEWMSFATLGKVLLLLLLADLTNTAMMFFLTSFFVSNNAFSTATTVIGTLIGFITGIYLPIGMLPEPVRWVIRLFPTSHAAVLLRQTMMQESMQTGFAGAPTQVVADFNEQLGVTFRFGDTTLTALGSVLILLGYAAVFYVLAVMVNARKKRA